MFVTLDDFVTKCSGGRDTSPKINQAIMSEGYVLIDTRDF